MTSNENSKEQTNELGRNEPCHCGSGKKYKRCHGVGAAPKFTPPKALAPAGEANPMAGGMPGGFDPSQMDPKMMLQFTQMLQRLPKGQLQKLQVVMQKAMSGKDVTREAAEMERTFPVELQELMKSFTGQMQGMGGMGAAAPAPSGEMTEEEARQIVAAAAAQGKISEEKATDLLSAPPQDDSDKKGGIGKLWRGLKGK